MLKSVLYVSDTIIFKTMHWVTGSQWSLINNGVTESNFVLRKNRRAAQFITVLCSWARHLTLTVPLSTQEYKWVPANCWRNLTNSRGVTCDGPTSRPGVVEILLAASCYRNRDKLRQLRASRLQGFTVHNNLKFWKSRRTIMYTFPLLPLFTNQQSMLFIP